MTEEITTNLFSLRPSAHAMETFRRKSVKVGCAAVVPVAVLVVWGLFDWRMLVVAAALVFLVVPPALLFSWFAVVSSKEAVRSLYPQRVSLAGDALTVEYREMPPLHEPASEEGEPSAVTDRKPGYVPEPLVISLQKVENCYRQGANILVEYVGGKLLIVPSEAFPTSAEAERFVSVLQGAAFISVPIQQ